MFSYSSFFKTITLSTSLITLVTGNQVVAQVISEIGVDPYNDSSSQSVPIEITAPKVNTPKIETPKSTSNIDTIYIQASPRPVVPPQLTGKLTSSDKSLPPIPSISEPYSKQPPQNTNSTSDNSVSTSISVSPFDLTPSDNSIGKAKQSKDIQVNTSLPLNSVKNSEENENIDVKITPPTQTRRTLRDILVQSNSNYQSTSLVKSNSIETNKNQVVYKVLVKVNNEEEKNQVKTLYPEAFTKTIKGDSFLQIGIFSNKENVEEISQAIANIGLKAIIQ